MSQPSRQPRGHILIVDDHAMNLTLLSTLLTDDGYEVRTAQGGALGLRSALLSPPELILLDVNMPELNGYDVCRELRAERSTRDIPIVFISALDAIGDKVMAFEAGGADYITKPFQMREVLARVATQFTILRQRREIEGLRGEVDARHLQIDELKEALRVRRASPADGAPAAEPAAMSRQTLTTLVTEIHGFVRVAGEIEPGRLLADLDYYLAVLSRIVGDHGGEVERWTADCLVAFFRDAAGAVGAATAIQRRVGELNQARAASGSPPFPTRIGVATGPTLVARRGREITLIGEAVSLAAKLESDARPGGILLDNATFDAAGHPSDTRHLIMRVRGKAELIKAHEIVPDVDPASPGGTRPR